MASDGYRGSRRGEELGGLQEIDNPAGEEGFPQMRKEVIPGGGARN